MHAAGLSDGASEEPDVDKADRGAGLSGDGSALAKVVLTASADRGFAPCPAVQSSMSTRAMSSVRGPQEHRGGPSPVSSAGRPFGQGRSHITWRLTWLAMLC